jgi:cell division protein ZipA
MDAHTLRLILIVFGGAVLAGHYFFERWREARTADDFPDDDGLEDKREPRLGIWRRRRQTDEEESDEDADFDEDLLFRPIGDSEGDADPSVTESASMNEASLQPLILQLSVVASAESRFDGPAIVRAAGRCRLEPGEMDIFHRYRGAASSGDVLFSMANLVKPGTFPFGAMADFTSPGLSVFAEAAGEPGDPQLLDEMLETAKDLADELGGVVLDDRRHRLTPDGEHRLHQRVLALTGARSGLREQA